MGKEFTILPSSKEKMSHIGTGEHVSTEEFLWYLFLSDDEVVDDYLMSAAARINHHVYICKECEKKYTAMRQIAAVGKFYERIMDSAKTLTSTDSSDEAKEKALSYIDGEIVLFEKLEMID